RLRLRLRLGRNRRRRFLRPLHQRVDAAEVLGAGAAGLLQIADRLLVMPEVQLSDGAVVVRVVVDEDRAVGARLVALLRIAVDGPGHLLDDGLPLALAHGVEAGIVVVVPRRERRGRGEEDNGAQRARASHGFWISFWSSLRSTLPRFFRY